MAVLFQKTGRIGDRFVTGGLLIAMLGIGYFPETSMAVAFKKIASDGTRYFICETACGDVRVKKITRDQYRVFSIGFSGILSARSEKEAAEKACGEREMSGSKRNPPVSDRRGACK